MCVGEGDKHQPFALDHVASSLPHFSQLVGNISCFWSLCQEEEYSGGWVFQELRVLAELRLQT